MVGLRTSFGYAYCNDEIRFILDRQSCGGWFLHQLSGDDSLPCGSSLVAIHRPTKSE